MPFCINCLQIVEHKDRNKELYKNLKSKNYLFNDFYKESSDGKLCNNPDNHLIDRFFDSVNNSINIQAVVGKNGSGKSTLMDIMYMAINNFTFLFEQRKKRPGADELYFVKGLYVNLYFVVYDGCELQELKLECKGPKIKLLKRKYNWWSLIHCASFELWKINKHFNKKTDSPIISLVSKFFYTVVSNYSMQSFISSNYIESTFDYNLKNRRRPWINSIFYKNDGYVRPIVLNPFRNSGVIDLENEQNLSKDRATSLFVYALYNENGEKKFFKPYIFSDLKIKYESSIVRDKINRIIKKNVKEAQIFRSELSILKSIDDEIKNKQSFLHYLEKIFFFELQINSPKKKKICASYLMFKIWNLTKKYIFYNPYENGLDYLSGVGFVIKNKRSISNLLKKINQDDSHATKKIKRSLNYLQMSDNRVLKDSFSGLEYFRSLEKCYLQKIKKSQETNLNEWLYFNRNNPFCLENNFSFISPYRVDLSLPPPIFSYELILKKENNLSKKIKYSRLSSGELQLLQTLSVHAYHISNLLSVQDKNRPKYRNINLVFDEVEICFHPEYQRSFINRFIEMAYDMNWIPQSLINVFVLTHSPFILSDIPSSNILYMENGLMLDKKQCGLQETFAQNVSVLLNQSFFMNYFIGDFAKQKIAELIDDIMKKNKTDQNQLKNRVNMIGDEFIKSQMKKRIEKV